MSSGCTYRPDVRVRLIGSQPFFGPGTAMLLRYINECGSVAAACEKMRLSYSKGRGMLRLMERELGCPIVRCTKGGVGGGSAMVTPEGERLLEIYTQYENMVSRYAQRRFDEVQKILQSEMRQALAATLP